MHNRVNILRWLLIVPSGIIGWYAALLIGILLYGVADYFCPPELMLSGSCQATWHAPVVDGLFIFGASLSAILVVVFSASMAPAKRITIAKVAYLAGFVVALYFAYSTSAWGAFFGAVISGALVVLLLVRYLKGNNCA